MTAEELTTTDNEVTAIEELLDDREDNLTVDFVERERDLIGRCS